MLSGSAPLYTWRTGRGMLLCETELLAVVRAALATFSTAPMTAAANASAIASNLLRRPVILKYPSAVLAGAG